MAYIPEQFPISDGIEAGITITPTYKTSVFESLSGRESRIAFRQNPKYTIKLSFEFLIQNRDEKALTDLLSHFNRAKGMANSFTFKNPLDNYAEKQYIGISSGLGDTFQLTRSFGNGVGSNEVVENTNNLDEHLFYKWDAATASYVQIPIGPANYYVSSDGKVTFFTANPEFGAQIYWSGTFYYWVRFAEDSYDFTKLMRDLYECRDIELIGSTRNIV